MDRSYSQFGEDVLIRDKLEQIGIANRWCFEVGAADGKFVSNTLLFRQQGWRAILAESRIEEYHKLAAEFGDQSICVHQHVDDLDALLGKYLAPRDIDVGIIDVDGQDYWLWHDMVIYRPRIVCIEFCPYPRCQRLPDPEKPVPRNPLRSNLQTARGPIEVLAREKGYELVADTYCNLIFVDKSVAAAIS